MGGGVRPPEYFKTMRGRALALTNLLTDEESAIKDLVAAKGLGDHFSFLPFTAETGEIYSALDIVTFPNQGVGLGRPVLEAATYGKPVVASGSDDGRRRAPARQDRDCCSTTRARRSSPPRCGCSSTTPSCADRLGEAAAEHAREQFDPARNARAVERVYDELLGLEAGAPQPAAGRAASRYDGGRSSASSRRR